ncbi:MAG TPA: phosphoadenylyl-sulfate reductase, partial [Methylophaga sp.]|nr:phosphoadenylyl-sulfate reductase [Methylophaga sp.]
MTDISEKLQLKIDTAKQLLEQIVTDYSPAVLATSYGAEDMVLMDMIAKFAPEIGIFTLDTGRLPKETYDLMQQAKKHYQLEVEVYYPDALSLQQFVTHNG